MTRKYFFFLFIFLMGTFIGYFIFSLRNPSFEKLNDEEMYERIIRERDYAIEKAVLAGDFRCCIEPPCTMCYMEANQWNNMKAGTCACDDLIAEGKEPCPQCKRGLSCDSIKACDIDK